MTSDFITQSITITTEHGAQLVTANCCGPIAIHKGIGDRRRAYAVTHIPTGRVIIHSPSFKKAERAVKIMLASSTPWASLTKNANRSRKVKEMRREWLLPIVRQGLIDLRDEKPEDFIRRLKLASALSEDRDG